MIDATRRGILQLFGIAAATAVPIAVQVQGCGEDTAKPPTLSQPDMLAVHPPEGMTYQWKRIFITAEEPDLGNILEMVSAGWKPVPAARHRENFPEHIGAYWVEIGGVVLMEKPTKDIPLPRPHPLPFECRNA